MLAFSPSQELQKISWKEHQQLTWEDFQGSPQRGSRYAASASTGIHFTYSYSSGKEIQLQYSVTSFFNKNESWVLPERADANLLGHEQTHFDITELHARILRKRLAEKKFSKNIKSEIERIYLQVEHERKKMQNRFDSETKHGADLQKERYWEEKIAALLIRYENWK